MIIFHKTENSLYNLATQEQAAAEEEKHKGLRTGMNSSIKSTVSSCKKLPNKLLVVVQPSTELLIKKQTGMHQE